METSNYDRLKTGKIRLGDKKGERWVWFESGNLTKKGAWVSTAGGKRVFIATEELNSEWEIK